MHSSGVFWTVRTASEFIDFDLISSLCSIQSCERSYWPSTDHHDTVTRSSSSSRHSEALAGTVKDSCSVALRPKPRNQREIKT